MKIFGVNVELDFRAPDLEETNAKLARYEELRDRVEDEDRSYSSEWQQDMEEQVGLFYELKDSVAGFLSDDAQGRCEVEEDRRPWWKRW